MGDALSSKADTSASRRRRIVNTIPPHRRWRGNRNSTRTRRLKQLWKKLVRMFHPDLHGVAHAPPRVVFSALAGNGRLPCETGSLVMRADHAARARALRSAGILPAGGERTFCPQCGGRQDVACPTADRMSALGFGHLKVGLFLIWRTYTDLRYCRAWKTTCVTPCWK